MMATRIMWLYSELEESPKNNMLKDPIVTGIWGDTSKDSNMLGHDAMMMAARAPTSHMALQDELEGNPKNNKLKDMVWIWCIGIYQQRFKPLSSDEIWFELGRNTRYQTSPRTKAPQHSG